MFYLLIPLRKTKGTLILTYNYYNYVHVNLNSSVFQEPHTTGGQSSTNETSTPAKMKKVSARVQRSLTRVKTPPPVGVRRSSRQRSSTQHYTAPPTGLRSSPHTLTPHSLTPHTLTPHREKGSVSVESPTPTIDHSASQSPLTTPSPIKPLASPPENIAPDFRSEKKLELVTLIESRTELLRRNKLAVQLKDKEDRNRKREEIHAAREELKIKAIEDKERERTEKNATRAKVLLTQSVLKEARRDRRLRQRERERVGKQAELHALKERRVAEKLQRRELAAAPLLENSPKVQYFGQKPWTVIRRFCRNRGHSLWSFYSTVEGDMKLKFAPFCSS